MSDGGSTETGADSPAAGQRNLTAGGQSASAFAFHTHREAAVGEVHTRPFRPVEQPRVLHHMAFESRFDDGEAYESLARFCRAHGALPPDPDARHHIVALGGAELRWELHTEFTTMTLSVAPPPGDPFAAPNIASLAAFLPKAPGPLIVATRLALISGGHGLPDLSTFDPAVLCVAEVDGGAGLVATDFRPDPSGFTRILVASRNLSPSRAGALVQRLLEIETYRTLTLLGLPEARRLGPNLDHIEAELTHLIRQMREQAGFESSRELLARLIDLAAGIEAESATATYRFGATRAYWEIVQQRLLSIREERVQGYGTLEGFLARRIKPALRTCEAVEGRLDDLAQKLARTSNLLRTRVDIELESQNRDLLESMNRRARQQLRLQQTVEGLSVAAVSYYVVGLIGYLVKGGETVLGLPFDPAIATAAAVPVAVLLVWLLVRRIRGSHSEGE